MALYTISDLHLSLGSEKTMEVFPGWEHYIEKLEKNWTSTVSENDSVVICGDISWSMKLEEAVKDFEFLNSLPGEKIILKGNHDYWWATCKKIRDFMDYHGFKNFKILHNNCIKSQGFSICGTRGWTLKDQNIHDLKMVDREIIRLRLSIESRTSVDPIIVFFHYPPYYSGGDTKMIDFLCSYGVKCCYYGHVHSKDSSKYVCSKVVKGVCCELVSADYLNFQPKLINV